MGRDLSRRKVAAYIAGTALCPSGTLYAQSVSLRPRSRPGSATSSEIDRFVKRAGINGKLGVCAINLESGKVIYKKNHNQSFAPASVLKVITALYALETLGPNFQYSTRIFADGSIKNGHLSGNLYLVGSGDPMLDTNNLFVLAKEVKAAGIRSVSGALLYNGHKINKISQIDSLQPVQAGYNPSLSGLNLNFNRVYFEWAKSTANAEVWLGARGSGVFPKSNTIEISPVTDQSPVYTYTETADKESWTVAQEALNEKGGVWLPVRKPELYCADIFRDLLGRLGIHIRRQSPVTELPNLYPIASYESIPMNEMLIHMLRYSINLTAEIVGMTATQKRGGDATSLASSAGNMQLWAQQKFSMDNANFIDHSGLGDRSRLKPSDLSSTLYKISKERPEFLSLLRKIKPRDKFGKIDASSKLDIRAKTGTLNFVSSLAGYVIGGVNAPFAFTVMLQNLSRRVEAQANGLDVAPKGSKRWNVRSRGLQHQLLSILGKTE